ncbi:hypothetical protein IWZ00DRAFT_263930 [Phyllosticta capitalensis]
MRHLPRARRLSIQLCRHSYTCALFTPEFRCRHFTSSNSTHTRDLDSRRPRTAAVRSDRNSYSHYSLPSRLGKWRRFPKHTIAPYRRRVAGSSSIYRYNFTPRASVHCKSPWPGQQGNRVRKSQVHHSTRDYARTRAQRRPMAKVPAEPVGRERATTNDHACLQAVIEAASYADKTVAAAVAAAAETTPCMIAGGCRLLACVQR